MIDLTLLRIAKNRDEYRRIRGRVPDSAFDPQTVALLTDFGYYFEQLPEHDKIDHATFLPMFRARHPTLSAEQKQTFDTILSNALTVDVGEAERGMVMRSMVELRLGTSLANLLARYDAGDVDNIYTEVSTALDEFKADVGVASLDFIRDDIGDILQEEIDETGLLWRMKALNDHVRPLRPGDFGIVAGRPDKGKTTFIASELTQLASQLPDGQSALWLNNEGQGRRIKPRLYQAALGLKLSEILALHESGKLKAAYEKVMGDVDRIKILDIHNIDNYAVEGLVDKHQPGIVIYDMIDNIRGFGDAARTDLGLEKMYQWGRSLAVDAGHAAIATSQISNEGDNLQYPSLGMLKDSKTGKQGACDFQLMIGAIDDPGYANMRFIGMPKNKLRREGAAPDPRTGVKYDPERARYEDIIEIPEEGSANAR